MREIISPIDRGLAHRSRNKKKKEEGAREQKIGPRETGENYVIIRITILVLHVYSGYRNFCGQDVSLEGAGVDEKDLHLRPLGRVCGLTGIRNIREVCRLHRPRCFLKHYNAKPRSK